MRYEPDRLYTADEMEALKKTFDGRKQLMAYFTSARVAYGMQKIFEMLDVVPDPATQRACCEHMYETMLRVPICYILDWCGQVVDWKQDEYHEGMEC